MGTPMGMKKDPDNKRTRIKPVSNKMKEKLPTYRALINELRQKCNNRSELSGEMGDWRTAFRVEPHHIKGRVGKHLTNPFEILLVTRAEHLIIEESNGYQEKEKLLDFIRPIRIEQGYVE